MSSHEIQHNMESQPLDDIDRLIRWALVDEVGGEEPSPQVWHRIQARLVTHSRAVPSQSRVKRPWRQFASALQGWAAIFVAPLVTLYVVLTAPLPTL